MGPLFIVSENRYTYLFFACIVLVLTLVLFGGLSEHLFESDDFGYIKKAASTLNDPSLLLSGSGFGRPVVEAVFLFAYILWGNNPAGYHILLVGLHVAASLVLVYTFKQFGTDIELSFVAALLFFLNIAHFRAVHWVSCIAYPVGLIFVFLTLICYVRHLESNRFYWIVGAAGMLSLAVFSHPATIFVTPFCFYLRWRRAKASDAILASTLPIGAAACFLIVFLLYHYPESPQVTEHITAINLDLSGLTGQFCWFLGRLCSSTFWLPLDLTAPSLWEKLAGILAFGGILALFFRKRLPVTDWAVWTVLALLPFISNPNQPFLTAGPSRYLYFASVGSSLLLAWLIRLMIHHVVRLLGDWCGKPILVCVLLGVFFTSFVSLKRAESTSFYQSGRYYFAQGNIDIGRDLFERAILQDSRRLPLIATVALGYGIPFSNHLDRALVKHPTSPKLNILSGISTFLQEDPTVQRMGEERILSVLKAAEDREQLKTKTALAYVNVATYFHNLKNYKAAVDLYGKALGLRPNLRIALFNLSLALYAQGQSNKAIQVMKLIAELSPTDLRVQQNLGHMLYEKDYIHEAIEVYQQILQVYPDNQDAHARIFRARQVLEKAKMDGEVDTAP